MITHHKNYGLFSENCQAFAVRNLAASALCPLCNQSCARRDAPESHSRGPTNAFYAMYAILCLRSEFFAVPFVAGLLAVIRKIFNLPWNFEPAATFKLVTLLLICSIIVAMIPSSEEELLTIREINWTTLFDWELEQAPAFSWDDTKSFLGSLSFGNKDFDCSECARIAFNRAIRTHLCFEYHSHGRPRPPNVSWLIPKIVLSFPVWSGTLLTAFITNTLWRFSWPYWVAGMIAYQFLIAGISMTLHGDLCKVGMGVKLLYSRSSFLLAWVGIFNTVLLYGDIAYFGDWPDLDRFGVLKYPLCLVFMDEALKYVILYTISPRNLSKWIKVPPGGQIDRAFQKFINYYEYAWKVYQKWYLRYHWWGCIAVATTLLCRASKSVLGERRATLLF